MKVLESIRLLGMDSRGSRKTTIFGGLTAPALGILSVSKI